MLQRNPINFDFHVVALMTIIITRPDVLSDFLKGKTTPLVLFPDQLLSRMKFLLSQNGVLDAVETVQVFYKTLLAYEMYCDETCPDDDWFPPFLAATSQIQQQLKPAGVEVEA